jgi:hypothetical protein
LANSQNTIAMSKLHPTLKLCHCGFIGTRNDFYDHMKIKERMHLFFGGTLKEHYANHGERVLDEDDPRAEKYLNEKWLEGTPKGYND